VRYGPTAKPLAGTWVVLHRVGMQGRGGPVDSVRTGPGGRYRLVISRVDTTAMYVASSWHAGIAYFSEPIPTARGRAAALGPIVVYDTTSGGPPIRVARRLVTIALPKKEDGTRSVLELLALENPGKATRITNDTIHPTWAGLLPHGVVQFEAGQGDISAEAVAVRGDSVLVFGPIPPGGEKQLSYSYTLPGTAEAVAIPIDQPTGELDLLLEDTTTHVTAPGVESDGVQPIEQRRFASYRARSLPGASMATLAFPRLRLQVLSLIPYVVALLAVFLIVGLVIALRKPSDPLRP
jgi:hypothetical protein